MTMRKLLLFALLALQPFAVLAQSATPISGLPAATTPLTGTEVVPIVQSGATKKATAANIQQSGTQTANTVLAAPNGSSGAPSFRGLVTADIPTGTSGATIPLQNGANNWSALNSYTTGLSVPINGANPFIAPTQWNGNSFAAPIATAGTYTLNGRQFYDAVQQVSSWLSNTGTEHTYAGFFQTQVTTNGTSAFTASQAGTNLTVSAVSSGSLIVGQTLYGAGVPSLETIVSQTSGSAGGAGVYVVTNSATISSESMTGVNQGYGWGLQDVCYTYGQNSECVGMEIDFGTQTSSVGAEAIGLGINAAGTTGTNYLAGLQFGSLGIGGAMTTGISFVGSNGYSVYTNALISTGANVTPTYGIDLSNASFGSAAIKSNGFVLDNVGALTVKSVTASNPVSLSNTVASGTRYVSIQTSGSQRWTLGADNAAESGSNAGSNLALSTWSDTGAFLQNVIYITRQTGVVIFNGAIRVSPVTYAQLTGTIDPSPGMGDRAYVTDAATCAFGTIIAGGGSAKCPVNYNGANWVGG